jgi:hypothetical protein
MLSGGNLGFGGSWNDVLWLSSYTGGDVKNSWAIVGDKYSDNVYISRQNFDSATWGTGYKLWHNGNDGAGSGLDADLWDSYQFADYLNQAVRTSDSPTFSKIRLTAAGNSSGGNILMGPAGEGSNKFSTLTGTHFNATSQAQGTTIIGAYNSAAANQIYIGGNIYEANPATQIDFYTHTAITHATGGSLRMSINSSGNVIANVDFRAPIFRDSDSTGYFLDPATSGISLRIAGTVHSGGAFSSDGYSTSSPNVVSRITAPQGAAFSSDGSTGAIRIKLPFRGNDNMWTMTVRIYNYSTNQTSEYLLGNYAYDQGGYNSSATFIGGVSATAHTVRFGNQDGVDCVWIGETNTGWSYPVVSVIDFTSGFRNSNADAHSRNWNITVVTSFGTVQTTITPEIRLSNAYAPTFRADTAMYAPIYYDSNDPNNYYLNPNSTSRINELTTDGRVVIGGNFSNQAYSSVGSTRLHFGGGDSDANSNYYIGTNIENFGGSYTKLDLRWHTGIRMGAQPGYGGVRFYNNEDLDAVILSVGTSDANVKVTNSLIAGSTGTPQATIQSVGNLRWSSGGNSYYTYSDMDGGGLYIETVDNGTSRAKMRFQTRPSNSGAYTSYQIDSNNNAHYWAINGTNYLTLDTGNLTVNNAGLVVNGLARFNNSGAPFMRWHNTTAAGYMLMGMYDDNGTQRVWFGMGGRTQTFGSYAAYSTDGLSMNLDGSGAINISNRGSSKRINLNTGAEGSSNFTTLRVDNQTVTVTPDSVNGNLRSPLYYVSDDTTYLWNSNRIVVNQVTFPRRLWDFSWGAHGSGSGTQSMSFRMWDNYTQGGAPSSYGTLIEYYGLSGHQHDQFYFYQGEILHRYGWYGTTNWQSGWRAMLHAGNYSGYAIPISGGINMTGSFGLNDQRLRADYPMLE